MSDKPTILIADDETHIVYIVEAKLLKAGYDVVVARNGEEALKRALEHRPALAITDLNMPVMDGLQFSVALRAEAKTAEIPVIMLTGRGHTVPEQDLAQTNICHLESKPFSAKHLLSLVQDVLAQRQAA
ncbi:response regulator [Algisphaera agarilytica]|uniref:CheY-like chemotaxis protein n=1 Tax=Algisphaera agarilytica TaxID=1385975 RepID=A0A7X0H6Y2_9BACT|nr:response regulator [Algisphaera agarilytica]MBB6429261.1 CheY-like chemotaxis protein [Algisphaera agarilytica]